MKKRISLLTALLSLTLLLSGCGAAPLPESMDQEATGEAGRAIVTMLTQGDYQGVADAFHPDLRVTYGVTPEKIAEIMAAASGAGPFLKFEETLAVGGKSDSYAGEYACVVIYTEHEQSDVIYELSLTPDLALIGLSVKEK